MGLWQAGFDVTGIDLLPQRRYPFVLMTGDALALTAEYLAEFDMIWASPPCQMYTVATGLDHAREPRALFNTFADLIPETRKLLMTSGKPYIIENVVKAPLIDPIMLCGAQFGLRVYRHRLFESNTVLYEPPKCVHKNKVAPMGLPPLEDEFISVVGHFGAKAAAQDAMGIDWMSNEEMSQAIPPAYSQFLGKQIIDQLHPRKVGSCETYGPVLSAVEGM